MRKLPLLLVVLMALVACSSAQAARTELTLYWCCGTPNVGQMWTDMAREFESLNPDIKVNVLFPPGAGTYYNKVTVAMMAGSGPDVMWLGGGLYSLTDFLMPLQDVVAGDASLKTIPQTLLAMNMWQGNLMGLPFGLSVYTLFYNKALLSEAGVKAPTTVLTWDELINTARKLTKDTDGDAKIDSWGFSGVNSGWDHLYSYGGNPYTEDGRHLRMYNPENVNAWKIAQSIYNNGEVIPNINEMSLSSIKTFTNSKLAMTVEGNYSMDSLDKAGLQYDLAPFPSLNYEGRNIRVGQATPVSLAVSAQTKHPVEAIKLLKFLTNKENMNVYARTGYAVTTVPSSMPTFINADKVHNRKVFIDEIPYFGQYIFQNAAYLKIERTLSLVGRDNILANKMTVSEALETAQTQANALLDEFWANR